jgi:hypothetical protein
MMAQHTVFQMCRFRQLCVYPQHQYLQSFQNRQGIPAQCFVISLAFFYCGAGVGEPYSPLLFISQVSRSDFLYLYLLPSFARGIPKDCPFWYRNDLLTCKCAAASPRLIQRSDGVSIYYFSYFLFGY